MAISKAYPTGDVLHDITYIKLVVRVVPFVHHLIYWEDRVWPRIDGLMAFVNPEGEVFISTFSTLIQFSPYPRLPTRVFDSLRIVLRRPPAPALDPNLGLRRSPLSTD